MIDVFFNQELLMALAINIVAAIGMNIVYSTGQLNLGQAGFFAVGAYTAAYAGNAWGVSLPLLLLAAAFSAALVAVPVAFVTRRLRGIYFIMATLAVGEIVRIVVGKLEVLGGGLGYEVEVPRLRVAEAMVVLAVVALGATALMASRFGLQMRSLFDDEVAAAAVGVTVGRIRMLSAVISAGVVGVAGGMFAAWLSFLEPTSFNFEKSFEIALFTLIGGVHSVLGAIVGVLVVTLGGGSEFSLWPSFLVTPGWRLAAFGVIVMLLVARRPEGIVDRATALAVTAPFRRWYRRLGPEHTRVSFVRARERGSVPDVVLSLREVRHSYDGVDALESVNLDVHRGEVLALIGANGAGKTTLIDVVTGAVRLQRGRVLLGCRDMGAEQIEVRARLGIGRTFQNVRTFDHLTVGEGIRLGGVACGGIDETRLEELLSATDLEDRRDDLPAALTLSEKRMLDIARALAGAPTVMLLDEPSAGMNEGEREGLATMILAVRESGSTVVVVDHNLDLVRGIADRVAVLDFGALLAVGAPDVVFDDLAVRRAYLGDPEMPAPDGEEAT